MFKKFFIAAVVIMIAGAVFWGYKYYLENFKQSVPLAPNQEFPYSQPSKTPNEITKSALRIPDFEEKNIVFQPKKQPDGSEKAIMPEEVILGLRVPSFPVSFDQFFIQPSPKEPQKPQFQPSYFQDFIKRVQEAVSGAEQKIEERSVSAPTETFPGASKQAIAVSTEEIKLSLTPEEFDILYPDYFIKNLKEIQVFIKSYDPDYQIISEIKTDSDVRQIQENMIFTLFSANMLTKDEVERYITTIRFTLPQLQISELETAKIKNNTKTNSFLGSSLSAGYELMGKFWQLIAISRAKAKGPCGYCYVLPECFQVGSPNPLPGINIQRSFCYCTGCYYGWGCLDFCTGQSAIWDPGSSICGCG